MYEQVFNLTSRPFTSNHYVKHYFPATAIDEALEQCKMVIDRGAGTVVVVGDHGTGKTLLLAMLEEAFKERFRVVNISAALVRGREALLQNILYQLQINSRGLSENEMRLEVVGQLKGDQANGMLLMVDDAQKLSAGTIEEMQVLTDLIRDGQPQVRLVLAGSQGLEERLADTRLVAFNQRIAGRCFLSCLNSQEVESYVRAHLERAGAQPDVLFSPDSYRAIYEVSEGRPRYINQVCDHALIFSATRGVVPVTDSLVREAWYDIQKLPGSVAPSGSGASITPEALPSERIEQEGADGWTVLEFGQLSDSDPTTTEEPTAEKETAPVPEPTTVEASPKPETIQGPSFSVTPTGEVQSISRPDSPKVDETAIPAEESTPDVPVAETAAPGLPAVAEEQGVVPAVAGAALLATAMAGFGQTAETIEEPTATTPESFSQASPPVETTNEQVSAQVVEADSIPESPIAEQVAEDPFASDSFENEEVLTDAYSPFVAQQNQRSLGVTTEQLQGLTPNDGSVPETASENVAEAEAEEESFPTFDTAMKAPDPVREPITQTYDPRDAVETRQESESLGPNSLSEEFLVNSRAALLGSAESANTEDQSVDIEPVAGSGYVPLDPDAALIPQTTELEVEAAETAKPAATTPEIPHLIDANPDVAAQQEVPLAPTPQPTIAPPQIISSTFSVPDLPSLEAAPPVPADIPAPQVSVTPEPATTAEPQVTEQLVVPNNSFHEQVARPEDPEIRRQAEEIIRSMNASPGVGSEVSHETSVPQTVQYETNAIESTIQRSMAAYQPVEEPAQQPTPPVVLPDLGQIQDSLRSAQSGQGYPQVPPTQPVPPMPSVPQMQPVAEEPHTIAHPGQIPVQMASAEPVLPEQEILQQVQEQAAMFVESQQTSAPTSGQDDRDILAVEQNQSLESHDEGGQAAPETPMPAWSQQEPSQGDAARVDYQKLFDQLRNVQSNQE